MRDIVLISSAFIVGGVWRRWFGSGTLVPTPRSIKLLVWALLVACLAVWAGVPYWLVAYLVGITTGGWTLGHGSYFDLGRMPAGDNERAKFILDKLLGFEATPSWKRDALGLFITYGAWLWLAAFGLFVVGHWYLVPLLLSPFVVVAGYEIGWRVGVKHALIIGECVIGGWVLASLFIALYN